MQLFVSFWRGERGSALRAFANAAALTAVAAVGLASLLDRATRDGGKAIVALWQPKGETLIRPSGLGGAASAATQLGNLDTMPTGSIGRSIILDPCTGKQE
ncbi:MAG: hypothetical protein JO163_13135 [Methylobacteriaceae bacterium]|nr:hypothetical protein [Methylobacteriaceae bacterium]MBV9637775.1 hypothetical protein [Methylobacteriaceae bacterium]MBV9703666.1 hypothetical protein [Methylobacteriaceae bacterium]